MIAAKHGARMTAATSQDHTCPTFAAEWRVMCAYILLHAYYEHYEHGKRLKTTHLEDRLSIM
jgi:hypothetical protein